MRLAEHTTAIYVLAKHTGFQNTLSIEEPTVKVAGFNAVLGMYKTEEQAKRWMLALYAAGIEKSALTITTGEPLPDEDSVGHVSARSRMWSWGRLGMLIGAGWGLVFDSVLFTIPGVEPFRMASPLVSWIVAVLEGTVVFGFAGAIAAGLAGLGLRRYRVTRTGTDTSGFALRAHGAAATIAAARKAVGDGGHSLLDGLGYGPLARPAYEA